MRYAHASSDMVARIPMKLQVPLLKAFAEYSIHPGDDHGAVTALRNAPAVRRVRQYDLIVSADEGALYAIHNMLRRIQFSGDLVESISKREAQTLARLAERVANRMHRAWLMNVGAPVDRVA
jgi:hypothetical protein